MKNVTSNRQCSRPQPNFQLRTPGFTLIELLIVIAIIAIIASILFPVFARVRENARRASCNSNEKQQALGLMQYAQDYDERLPCVGATSTMKTTGNALWASLIQPYVKSVQIFRCPNAPRTTYNINNVEYSTYCLPGTDRPTNPRFTILNVEGLHLSEVQQPARTFMILESWQTNYFTNGEANSVCQLSGYAAPELGVSVLETIHFDGYNVAFVDGHVKWIKNGTGKNWIFNLYTQ